MISQELSIADKVEPDISITDKAENNIWVS